MKKKGRGMSFDEKREVMLRIFHTTKTVYNYQQIQKLSVKAGIPFPSVKEILKSLQDDSLIENQKIGAGVFFWSFPSKAFQIFKSGIQSTQKQIELFKKENIQLQQKIQQGQQGRQDSQQRLQKLDFLSDLIKKKKQIQEQIEKYIRFDPERVELLKRQNQQKKAKINFWTDNLQQFKKNIKKSMPALTNQDLQNQFGIPVDLDYIE